MMYTKILALLVQTYLVSKASSPPSKNIPIKEVLSKEGFFGLIIARLVPKLTILFVALQSLLYIYVMIQQEIGSVPILNYKFPDWNSLEVILFVLAIGGISLRLWCFKTLEEFFTFNVTVKKDHKLVTTGPYSLLVHPSYTGGTLMVLNLVFLWYQLTCVPASFPFGRFGTFVRAFSWFNIATLTIFLALVYKRVPYEEKVLRKHFDKEWDSYFSQRKRFIPFII